MGIISWLRGRQQKADCDRELEQEAKKYHATNKYGGRLFVDGATCEESCEDENTLYFTFPDGLRLIFRNGFYAGWYVCDAEVNDG